MCARLVWSDPPARLRPAQPEWLPDAEVLAELRRQRRRARVWESRPRRTQYAVERIRAGLVPELPAALWEASSARLGDGRSGLWLRYVGPEDA